MKNSKDIRDAPWGVLEETKYAQLVVQVVVDQQNVKKIFNTEQIPILFTEP